MVEASNPFPAIRGLLDQAGVRYALIGGHAVNAYVQARLTADIDLVVASASGAVGDVVGAFLDGGWRLDAEHGGNQESGPDFVRLVKEGSPLGSALRACGRWPPKASDFQSLEAT